MIFRSYLFEYGIISALWYDEKKIVFFSQILFLIEQDYKAYGVIQAAMNLSIIYKKIQWTTLDIHLNYVFAEGYLYRNKVVWLQFILFAIFFTHWNEWERINLSGSIFFKTKLSIEWHFKQYRIDFIQSTTKNWWLINDIFSKLVNVFLWWILLWEQRGSQLYYCRNFIFHCISIL